MRLMFVARAIDGIAGGVERMVTTIMNALVARGHDVDFLTWDEAGATSFYPMASDIVWHRLDMGSPKVRATKMLMLRRAAKVRDLVRRRRPEAVVCFQEGPFVAMRAYTAGMRVPVIVAERNAPTRYDHTSAVRYRDITYQAFRFARRILVQCESYRDLYPPFLRANIVTVPNPVQPARRLASPATPDADGRFRLLSVGRLGYQKNYLALVEAFAAVVGRFPDWDLAIVGEGQDRAKLEGAIGEHRLDRRVSLPGPVADVERWYATSHLFCLPARWEGFPNALAEAMAHALPSVGYAGCAGVRDLIMSGDNGLLAAGNGDVTSLAEALAALMADADLRLAMGQRAERTVASFAPEAIFDLWERTLREAIGH